MPSSFHLAVDNFGLLPIILPVNHASRTEQIFREANAILENDHFVSVNGYHGAGWIDKDAINPHLVLVDELCTMLWDTAKGLTPEIICGPAEGGLIVSLWTGFRSGLGRFILRRGYDRWIAGKRVLIVDDIVNTGHSVRQTAEAIQGAGGIVVGVACYVDRGNNPNLGGDWPVRYLMQWKIPAGPKRRALPKSWPVPSILAMPTAPSGSRARILPTLQKHESEKADGHVSFR